MKKNVKREGRHYFKTKTVEYTEIQSAADIKSIYEKHGDRQKNGSFTIGKTIYETLSALASESDEMLKSGTMGDPKDKSSFAYFIENCRVRCLRALNENNEIHHRLEAAYEAGQFQQAFKVARLESSEMKNRSSNRRSWPELDDWLQARLSKGDHWPVSALWADLPRGVSGDELDFYIDHNGKLIYNGEAGHRKPISENSFKNYVSSFKKRSDM